jgi:hypothetical protein
MKALKYIAQGAQLTGPAACDDDDGARKADRHHRRPASQGQRDGAVAPRPTAPRTRRAATPTPDVRRSGQRPPHHLFNWGDRPGRQSHQTHQRFRHRRRTRTSSTPRHRRSHRVDSPAPGLSSTRTRGTPARGSRPGRALFPYMGHGGKTAGSCLDPPDLAGLHGPTMRKRPPLWFRSPSPPRRWAAAAADSEICRSIRAAMYQHPPPQRQERLQLENWQEGAGESWCPDPSPPLYQRCPPPSRGSWAGSAWGGRGGGAGDRQSDTFTGQGCRAPASRLESLGAPRMMMGPASPPGYSPAGHAGPAMSSPVWSATASTPTRIRRAA